jgi:uncharacterized linocin/CFP29 family protein
MNILKKSIAPVTDKAWSEITQRTKQILDTNLSARKFLDIDGPYGLEMGGISTGRLIVTENKTVHGVNYGIRQMLPMVEIRRPFELDVWELDNLERGAKDIDLSPLEEAAREVALFEEKAVYQGFEPAGIKGLRASAETDPLTFPTNVNAFLKEIGNQINHLSRKAVEGPYSLILTESEWINLINLSQGYPVQLQLKEILGGQVLINHSNQNSFLISERGGDYELILGQDISIGYDGHDTRMVKLYFTSSFTFRVLSPEAIIVFNSQEQNDTT